MGDSELQVLQKVQGDLPTIEKKIKDLKVTDEASYGIAMESVALLKRMKGMVEDHRKQEVQPHNETVSRINGEHKQITQRIDTLLEPLNQKAGQYFLDKKREEDRLRMEQEAAYQKQLKAAEKKHEAPPAPPMPLQKTTPDSVRTEMFGTVSQRMILDFKILDENKVPREYLSVDMVKIGKMVRAKILKSQPWIQVYEKPSTSLR